MNESPSPTPGPERTVVVNTARLRTLTIASLILNGVVLLFLFLILVGAVIHHHREKMRGFAGGPDGGGCGCAEEFHGRHFHHFHHPGFGGFGGREEGFGPGGGGFDRGGGMGWKNHNFGDGQFGPGPGGGMGMENRDPAQVSDEIVDHLTQMLTLTDDQKAKIKPIVQADVTQFQKDAATWRQDMQKRIEEGKAKLKPILTADQQKKLDAMTPPGPGAAPDTSAADPSNSK